MGAAGSSSLCLLLLAAAFGQGSMPGAAAADASVPPARLSVEQAARLLSGRNITCVENQGNGNSDGFFQFRNVTLAEKVKAAVRAQEYQKEIPLPWTEISGFNVEVVQRIQLAVLSYGYAFNLSFASFQNALQPGKKKNDANAEVVTKYDCLLSSTQLKSDRYALFDYLTPHIPFGYQVIVPIQTPAQRTLSQRVLTVLRPFDVSLWVTILSLVVVSAFMIALLEGRPGVNDAEFGEHNAAHAITFVLNRLCHAGFRAVTILAMGEGLRPVTTAARVYLAGLGMCCLVLTAAYTANLAAFFTSQNIAEASITSIHDFERLGVPCCMKNSSSQMDYVREQYPGIEIRGVGDDDETVAKALLDGSCKGGVGTNVFLEHLMSTNAYQYGCRLQLVGSLLNHNYYAIPWKMYDSSEPDVNAAMDTLLTWLIHENKLADLMDKYFPTQFTDQCLAFESVKRDLVQLTVEDLAGIFIIQAFVLGAAVGIHLLLRLRTRHIHMAKGAIAKNPIKGLFKKVSGSAFFSVSMSPTPSSAITSPDSPTINKESPAALQAYVSSQGATKPAAVSKYHEDPGRR